MPVFKVDFTVERHGEDIVEAKDADEAKSKVLKKIRADVLYPRGKFYDWDVKANYAYENSP